MYQYISLIYLYLICKYCISISNIPIQDRSRTHDSNTEPLKKWIICWKNIGRRLEQIFFFFFFPKKTYGWQTGTVFNITYHWENAHQNHSDISPHMCRMAILQKTTDKELVSKDVQQRKSLRTADGNSHWHNHYGKQCSSPSKL